MNHSGMHIAKQTVHIEVEITIGFHFEVFRMVNLVPQTARYRSTVKFSLARPSLDSGQGRTFYWMKV